MRLGVDQQFAPTAGGDLSGEEVCHRLLAANAEWSAGGIAPRWSSSSLIAVLTCRSSTGIW
jgi:hypothetical protein